MPKSVAFYEPDGTDFIKVGYRANVFCKTHVRQELCNRPVHTSVVIWKDSESNDFETQNTIYMATE